MALMGRALWPQTLGPNGKTIKSLNTASGGAEKKSPPFPTHLWLLALRVLLISSWTVRSVWEETVPKTELTSSGTEFGPFMYHHLWCPVLVLSRNTAPDGPLPALLRPWGLSQGKKYLFLNLSVAFQRFSLKMNDGNKVGNSLKESFAPACPRKQLLLLQRKFIPDRCCQTPAKSWHPLPGFRHFLSHLNCL